MPIHLNLLAEAQAADELRRRDPVKRALWVMALLVVAMLGWSSWLHARSMLVGRALGRVENQIGVRTNEFQQVLDYQQKTGDIEMKLTALHQLATNRFLHGTLLNALQQTSVENVQVLRLKVEQAYVLTEEVKPKKTDSGRTVPRKPATATEKIAVIIEAKDTSPNPGDAVNRFKEKIAGHPFFLSALGKTNEVRLTFLSQPLSQPDGQPFVQFTLECRYPEKTR